MRSAIVANGKVANIIEGELPDSILCGDIVQIGWLYDGIAFAAPPPPPLSVEEQAQALKDTCRATIEGGFVSSALGTPHTYASTIEDQINLVGAASAGIDMDYQCTDGAGVKAERMHTAAQIAQVLADGVTFKAQTLADCRAAVAAL